MDKYTIEQLRTKGTKIQFTKPIVVNCKWWATDHDMLKDFSSISGIVSFGSDIRNGKECINIEKKEYSEHYYWLEDLDNGKTSLSYKDYKKDKGIKALETKIFYRNLELESLKKELNNLKNG